MTDGAAAPWADVVAQAGRVARLLVAPLLDQERALSNARRATTELLRRRVEREEVQLFLDGLVDEAGSPGDDEGWQAAPAVDRPGS